MRRTKTTKPPTKNKPKQQAGAKQKTERIKGKTFFQVHKESKMFESKHESNPKFTSDPKHEEKDKPGQKPGQPQKEQAEGPLVEEAGQPPHPEKSDEGAETKKED